MSKYKTLKDYLNTFNKDALAMYTELKDIILKLPLEVKERLFAGQVAFYLESTLKSTFHSSPVIILSFYKDHVNIFANTTKKHKQMLSSYKFTKNGTLQIYYNQLIEEDILAKIFVDSLTN